MRVTNLAQTQVLMAEMQRALAAEAKTAEQVSSGKVGTSYQELEGQAGALITAQRSLERLEHFDQTSTELKSKLEFQNLNLTELENIAGDLREEVMNAVATGDAATLMSSVESVFDRAVSVLNSTFNGEYIYGGTRIDTEPVNISSVYDLLSPTTVAEVFENNSLKPSASIDENSTLEYGFLASDLGTELFTALQTIVDYDDASGPLDGDLSDAQLTFLESQVAGLADVAEGVTEHAASNGIRQARVDDVLMRLESSKITLTQFVSDIEDVDLAEAVARLSQDQVALEAAVQMVARIGDISLLNYL